MQGKAGRKEARAIRRVAARIYWFNRTLRKCMSFEEWVGECIRRVADGHGSAENRRSLRQFLRRLARKLVHQYRKGGPDVNDRIREILPLARKAAGRVFSNFSWRALMKADVTPEDVALDAAWRVVRAGLPVSLIWRSARIAAIDRYREGLRNYIPPVSDVQEYSDPAERLRLQRRVLGKAAALPEREKRVFLFKLQGYDFKEIAGELGVSRRTVSRRFARAVRLLRSSGVFYEIEEETMSV